MGSSFGTAHVIMSREFLHKLFSEHFCSEIKILELKDCGDGYYNVLVESCLLPSGYQGQKELFIKRILSFKRDVDT